MWKTINKIIIHFLIFLIPQMIHTSNWIWELMEKFVFPYLLKTSTKLQQKSMFYARVIKKKIKYVIFNITIYSFSTNPYISIFIPKMCVYKCPQISQNSHSW
jgi:hypothetical protein